MAASNRRRRLLFLAPVVPTDRGNGLAMRVGFFLQAYSSEFDIDLAVFPLVSAPASSDGFARRRVARMVVFPHPGVDSHFALVAAVNEPEAQLAAFRRYGRPSLASFASEMARCALAEWTNGQQYDVVHVSRLYLAGVAEQWARAMTTRRPSLVVDCDEDDARTYRRMAAIERRQIQDHRAAWAEAEADAFVHLAQEVLPRFDLAFVASADEAKSLSAWSGRIAVVPNVAPSGNQRVRGGLKTGRKTVLFVGTMGYAPNDDAARWLVTRVWPRLRRASKASLRLVLAGSNPSPALIRLGRRQDVTVTGTVPDIRKFYREADLAVVPIRVGSGTRIKLLEAAARGIPIVSTTLGAEGTTFRHGRDLIIADTAEQFARTCAALLRHPAFARSLAARAVRRVALEYDGKRWARRVGQRVAALSNRGLE